MYIGEDKLVTLVIGEESEPFVRIEDLDRDNNLDFGLSAAALSHVRETPGHNGVHPVGEDFSWHIRGIPFTTEEFKTLLHWLDWVEARRDQFIELAKGL